MDAKTLYTRAGALEVLGKTLLHSQEFERSFGYCVGLIFSGRSMIGVPELEDIKKEASRITLGQFVERIKRSGSVCDAIEMKLKTVLEARNRMAHRLVDDPEFDLDSEAGCRRLVVFLIRLQSAMLELTLIFTGIEYEFIQEVTGSQIERKDAALFETIDSLGYRLATRGDAC